MMNRRKDSAPTGFPFAARTNLGGLETPFSLTFRDDGRFPLSVLGNWECGVGARKSRRLPVIGIPFT